MRIIQSHVENDRQPVLYAGPYVTPGNAPQLYEIVCENGKHTVLDFVTLEEDGVTNEVLLAVVIDRLEGFQAGPFACQENQDALDAARLSLDALHERTRERNARGVENKHEK